MGDMIRCPRCVTFHYRNDPCPDDERKPMRTYFETPSERFQRKADEVLERQDREISEAIRRDRFAEGPDPRIQRIIEHCRDGRSRMEAAQVAEDTSDCMVAFGFAYRTFQSILEECGVTV